MGVVGEVLHGVEVGGLGEGDALVFLAECLAGGGAVDEGDAEFPGEAEDECLGEQGLEEGGVLHIGYVEEAQLGGGGVDAAATEGPAAGVHAEHAQAVGRQAVAELVGGALGGGFAALQGGAGGGKAPAVGAEHLAAHGVVVHVAEACGEAAVGVDGGDGGFTQAAEGEVADIEHGGCGVFGGCSHGVGGCGPAVVHRLNVPQLRRAGKGRAGRGACLQAQGCCCGSCGLAGGGVVR